MSHAIAQDDDCRPGPLTAGLLNAIDGVAAQEGRLLFMTTNHVEALSGALVRPGRVDVRVRLRHASHVQIAAFLASFYQEHFALAATVWSAAGVEGRSLGTVGDWKSPEAG